MSEPKLLTVFKVFRSDFRKRTVHIPLDIADIVIFKHFVHSRKSIFLNFRFCEIEHKLMTHLAVCPLWIMINPIGMSTEQIAVPLHHLRLKPQTEIHTERINAVYKFINSVREFFGIYKPIAQACTVVVSLAEPTVIHNKKLATDFCRLFCKRKLIFGVYIKAGGFPRIVKHGKRPVGKRLRQNMCNRKL